MRNPHFFKAYCRIGIQNLPYGQSINANGVEEAPDFVLSNKFSNSPISKFDFKKPELIDPTNYFKSIFDEYIKFQKELEKNVKTNETLIIIGGDHSVTFSSILYDLNRFGNDIGIIHFDSHPDFNLFNSSPTKNFHGMYLRIFFDKFDLPYFEELVKTKLPLESLFFVGDLELNPEEANFFENNKMNVISSQIFKNEADKALLQIKKFVNKHSHIHISFDVDVFNSNLTPATGTPSKSGFEKEPIFEILEIIKKAKSFTLDVAEVNPKKKGKEQTIKIAQEVIEKLIN